MKFVSRALCTAALALAAGCNCGPNPNGNDAGDSGEISCDSDPRVATYAAGMEKASADNKVKVKLESSDPSPPSRGTDTWQVAVSDGAGNALGAATVKADIFMPDHGHGSSVTPEVTSQGGGNFEVGNLFFFMPGVWRTRFTVTNGSVVSQVDYLFCIPG